MKIVIKLILMIVFGLTTNLFAQEKNYVQFAASVKSSRETGFHEMLKDSISFMRAMGKEAYHSRMSKLIFRGDIEPKFAESKTWEQIKTEVQKLYGNLGEEAYLVVRSNIAYQMNQWNEYLPLAQTLLKKYGNHLTEAEKRKHEKAIEANESKTY